MRQNRDSKGPCIVITYPFPIGQKAAGGSRTLRQVAVHLSKMGARIIIVSVTTNPLSRRFPRMKVAAESLGTEIDSQLDEFGIKVIRVEQNPLHQMLDGLSVKRAIKDILGYQEIDLVLSHFQEGAFLPSFLQSRGVKFGYLATWQTYAYLTQQPGRLQRWLNRKMIIEPHQRAEIIFAISQFTRRELTEIMNVNTDRIIQCPLGVEPHFLNVAKAAPTEVTHFIYFGRIVPSKGVYDAIEALGKLTQKGYGNWTYKIIGQAGKHGIARVKKAVRKHGIEDKVILCEPMDDAGLRRELEQAHLAIMPSYVESFGLAFVEAQAAGVPVVAYEAGSVPEVVENGVSGWLAPFRQIDRLADCIEQAVKDPKATYEAGLAGRERVKSIFRWERTAEIILNGAQNLGIEMPVQGTKETTTASVA